MIEEQAAAKLGAIDALAEKAALWINKKRDGKHIEYLTMKLGIEMLLINLSKTLIVYAAAIVCHLLLQTIIIHGAYFAVRRASFGLHASTSFRCTLFSLILFVGIPYLSTYLVFNNVTVVIMGLICTWMLYLYAPADTEKFPLLGAKRRRKLRLKSVVTCLVITLVALFCPGSVKVLLMLGVALQIVTILPITYKLLKRSVKNYEKYETESV